MSYQGSRSYKCRGQIGPLTMCGCYYCLKTFLGREIKEWVDGEKTPLCPKCGIDSVVPYDYRKDGLVEEFRGHLKKWNKESFS